MIYIIDDKKSRQEDFGWDEKLFKTYSNDIVPVRSIEELSSLQESILQSGNTILFHESFFASEDASKQEIINAFKYSLKDGTDRLYIAYFSGSKGGRYVKDNICMLPPDVLYTNLEIFINKLKGGDINFKYLAFGENHTIEESIRERLDRINDENIGGDKVSVQNNIFFAVTSDDTEVEPPFNNISIIRDWDLAFRDNPISDIDLDKLVMNWFMERKYDAIYIPLCFGKTLSDFMGLRLAMHIRFTSTLNQTTPVFIYGAALYNEIKQNYCFDILKTTTVRLIHCDNSSLIKSNQLDIPECDLAKDLGIIHLDMPSNIGGHSLANQWGAEVLARVTNIKYDTPIEVSVSLKSIYFKYALFHTIFSKSNNIAIPKATKTEAIQSKGRRILLIDDEADRGWEQIVRALFVDAYIDVVQSKIPGFDALPEQFIKRIQNDFYDLYLLDLRLQGEKEESIVQTELFSGMDVLEGIKSVNPGNQVIMLTASNKAWNLKKIIKKKANGYYIKEDPELLLPYEFSVENYHSFKKDIMTAYNNLYKRDLWAQYDDLFGYIESSIIEDELKEELHSQLSIFEQFMLASTSIDNLSSVYLTLFQIFETIKQYYSREMDFSSSESYLPADIKKIINTFGSKSIDDNDSVYKMLKIANRARNNYVHKLHQTCEIDHKSVNGLRELFKVVSGVIHLL